MITRYYFYLGKGVYSLNLFVRASNAVYCKISSQVQIISSLCV